MAEPRPMREEPVEGVAAAAAAAAAAVSPTATGAAPPKKGPMIGAWFGVAAIGGTAVATATGTLDTWLRPIEENFNGQDAIDWTNAHAEIPVYGLAAYIFVVFHVSGTISTGWNLRSVWAVWNVLLSVFSIVGASRTVPLLVHTLRTEGGFYVACTDPAEWFLNGPAGMWTTLFVWSKLPELLDTVFLVLQKKPVIFLHWFHHVTVLLYCWHSFAMRTATGLWFIAMNYTVHSVMYAYYFLAIVRLKGLASKFAILITTMQIAQMIGGTAVTVMSGYWYYTLGVTEEGKPVCSVDPANFKMGFGMYLSYFILFASLFWDKYVLPKSQKPTSNVCGVAISKSTDPAGMFRANEGKKPEKTE